jgi:6-pyruvoyl-tetrahydropterin synthase
MEAEFFGIILDKLFKINSSHFIIYEGFREPLHGHNYKVSIKIKAKKLDDCYMVVDFDKVKVIMEKNCSELKHKVLLPKINKWLNINQQDGQLLLKCSDGAEFSFPVVDTKILEVEQISAECLAKYITQEFIKRFEEKHPDTSKKIEIIKIVCKVEEDIGKGAKYYIEYN